MKFYLDELLTDINVSQIPLTENNPLSLDRIIQKTISQCNAFAPASTHYRRHFPLSLVAAILVGLLATTTLAATISGYLRTVDIEYQVSEDGEILSPEEPDLGITLFVSNASPNGLVLSCSLDTTTSSRIVSAGSQYYLEMQTDSDWLVVPMLYEHQWQWDNQKIDGNQHSWHMDWTSLYGKLSPGNYRIQKPFTVTSNDGVVDTYFISEEFIIGG